MDKVIVYGALEFLGFHFCNRLLEKGYYVKGIQFDSIADDYLEEKRLEVGRNSNFEELTIQDLENLIELDDKPALIIFSLYDLFVTGNESVLTSQTVTAPVFQFLQRRKEQNDKIVFLLPVQLLADSKDRKGLEELEEFIKKTNEITKREQCFYLPTLFGQWQPTAFIFQRSISKLIQADNIPFPSREWISDAIFAGDAIEPLINTIEAKEEGRYLLESGIPDSWNKCADILKIDSRLRMDPEQGELTFEASEQINRLTLPKITSYHEALLIQINHMSQIMRRI